MIANDILVLNITLIIMYAFIGFIQITVSLYIVHRGRKELSTGYMRDFLSALLLTISIGFLFFMWIMFTKLGLINFQNPLHDIVITNLLAIGFLLSLTYLAFYANDLSKKFGFATIGKKVSMIADHKKKAKMNL